MTAPEIREGLAARLPTGARYAVSASHLGEELGCSRRTIGLAVAELIEDGWLVGSLCLAGDSGYFLPLDEAEVELGVAHIVARAKTSLHRVSILRRNARERFGHQTDRLFDVEGPAGMGEDGRTLPTLEVRSA